MKELTFFMFLTLVVSANKNAPSTPIVDETAEVTMDHGTTAHGKSKRLLRGKERMAETLEEERMNGPPIPVFYDFLALFEKSRPNPEPGPSTPVLQDFLSRLEEPRPNPEPAPVLPHGPSTPFTQHYPSWFKRPRPNPEPAPVLPHGPSTPVTQDFPSRSKKPRPNPAPAPVLPQQVDFWREQDQLEQAIKETLDLRKKCVELRVAEEAGNKERFRHYVMQTEVGKEFLESGGEINGMVADMRKPTAEMHKMEKYGVDPKKVDKGMKKLRREYLVLGDLPEDRIKAMATGNIIFKSHPNTPKNIEFVSSKWTRFKLDKFLQKNQQLLNKTDAAIESSSRDIYIASPPRGSGYIVNAILYPPSLIGLVLKYTNPPIL
ncbi:hypothetical protein PsorP6_000497 [Peronosclerospora sorghi]|uniref:Uncharacterized protein n=1 Tax=Peronosclerospora sorghi TaxID=230839 RepID=A0ACC0WR95_9STRA|nr:hypothetical protein PsorP6_000497 [Peronosclerospora sorghi]